VISADIEDSTAEVIVSSDIGFFLKSKNGDSVEVTLAVLADSANVSAEGKLNILGSFDTIGATKFPARHPEMQLVLRMEASPAEIGMDKKLEMQLRDEDGAKISGFNADFKVPEPSKPGEPVNIQMITRIGDVVFPKAGRYAIWILINGDSKGRVPFTVG
jgi:hypothetical protein